MSEQMLGSQDLSQQQINQQEQSDNGYYVTRSGRISKPPEKYGD